MVDVSFLHRTHATVLTLFRLQRPAIGATHAPIALHAIGNILVVKQLSGFEEIIHFGENASGRGFFTESLPHPAPFLHAYARQICYGRYRYRRAVPCVNPVACLLSTLPRGFPGKDHI